MSTKITEHFYENKNIIIGFSTSALLIGIITSLLLPVSYQSAATLFPATESNMQSTGVSSTLSSLIQGSSPVGSKLNKHFSILNSEDFIYSYLFSSGFIEELYEIQTNDAGEYEFKPNKNQAAKKFKTRFRSAYDIEKGEVKFYLISSSPTKAADYLNQLIYLLNKEIIAREVVLSKNNIDYLLTYSQPANSKANLALNQSIASLLTHETKNIMKAETNPYYAFEIIDSASTPSNRYKPNRSFIVLTFGFIGLFASFILLIIRNKEIRRKIIDF